MCFELVARLQSNISKECELTWQNQNMTARLGLQTSIMRLQVWWVMGIFPNFYWTLQPRFFFFWNLKLNMLHIELNDSLPSQSCFFLSILYVIHWYQWPPATESKSPDQFLLCFSFFTLATPIPDTQPEAVRTFRIHRDDDGQIWSDKNSKQLCMTKDIINKRWITDQFKYCLWYWFHSYSSNCISIVIIGCHIFSFHR